MERLDRRSPLEGLAPRLRVVQALLTAIFSRPALAWAVAAIQVVVLAFVLSGPADHHGYRTLSAPGAGEINLVFAPDTTEAEIRTLLSRVDAVIVGGPTPEGLYLLRLRDGDPAAVIRELRHDPRVRFVAPAVR